MVHSFDTLDFCAQRIMWTKGDLTLLSVGRKAQHCTENTDPPTSHHRAWGIVPPHFHLFPPQKKSQHLLLFPPPTEPQEPLSCQSNMGLKLARRPSGRNKNAAGPLRRPGAGPGERFASADGRGQEYHPRPWMGVSMFSGTLFPILNPDLSRKPSEPPRGKQRSGFEKNDG